MHIQVFCYVTLFISVSTSDVSKDLLYPHILGQPVTLFKTKYPKVLLE